MLFKVRSKLQKKWFDLQANAILQTPVVHSDPDSQLVILSQLYHPDLTMYLVAVKSLCRYLRPQRLVIVDDGLTAQDKQTLHAHLESLSFVPSAQVLSGKCPKGGTWERLLTIADLNGDAYVIQLDADTITVQRPDEVLACVASNASFALGTPGGRQVSSLLATSQIAATWEGSHVQTLAEQAMHRLPSDMGNRYVHGCSGFAGFKTGSITRSAIERFSNIMAEMLGTQKWQEWGSEQVTSNYMVANCPGAVILPPETYPFWKTGVSVAEARFFHFFGTHRFEGGMYARTAQSVVADLTGRRRT